VKFVIDENLPPALAALRVKQGHDCVHVAYAGLAGAADDAIRDLARTEHRVIVTRDGDFDLPDERSRLGIARTRFSWRGSRRV
jgi:predicted nuclease of predicted toxin-antitoxin system